jgi:hypothetical protein
MRHAISCTIYFYNTGVVVGRRIGSSSWFLASLLGSILALKVLSKSVRMRSEGAIPELPTRSRDYFKLQYIGRLDTRVYTIRYI